MLRPVTCLLALLVLASASLAQPGTPTRVSLLLYPVAAAPDLPPSYAPAVQAALTRALGNLRRPSVRITLFNPRSASVRRVLRERPFLDEEALSSGSPAFVHVLGEELGYDAALVCRLEQQGDQRLLLSARLISVRNRGTRAYALGGEAADFPAQASAQQLEEASARLLAAMTRDLPADLRAAVALPEATADDYRQRGQECQQQGRYYEAIHEYDRALAVDAKQVDCYLEQARCYLKVGDQKSAHLQLRRALTLEPGNPGAGALLAEMELGAGKPERALLRYEEVLAAQPEHREALAGKGRLLASLGRYEEAVPCYQRLLAQEPQDRSALAGLAECWQRLGKDEQAAESYRQLLGLDPSLQQARYALIAIYVRAGKLGQAVEQYRQAFELSSQPVAYSPADYTALGSLLDQEAEQVRAGALAAWRSYQAGEQPKEQLASELAAYYLRSDNLARAAEHVLAPDNLQGGHRYRVFAYNLLHESNFELQSFLESSDARRYDRAIMLRDACSSALSKAQSLEAQARLTVASDGRR